MPNFTCTNEQCGKEFYSRHSTAQYCGRRCAGIATTADPAVRERRRQGMLKYTDEWLIQHLVDLGEHLGRTPRMRDTKPSSDTWLRFGSYNNALVTAGFVPNVQMPERHFDGDGAHVPLKLRFRVLSRDGFRCRYCGGTPQDGYVLHADHVVPRSKGGKTAIENLVTACSLCNQGKSDSLLPATAPAPVVQWQNAGS